MSLQHNISANQITALVVAFLGLGLAVYIGTLVGNEDFALASAILLAIAAVAYFTQASAYWLWLSFVWGAIGFFIRPLGPTISGVHIALLLGTVFVAGYSWRKPPVLHTDANSLLRFFRPFMLSLLVYLFYMGLNAALTMFYSHEPYPVSWANLAKQNVNMWGAFLLVAIVLRYPLFCRLPKNIGSAIIFALILGLLVNTTIRAYATFILGLGEQAGLGELQPELGATALSVPVVNLSDDMYSLRTLAPFCALFAVTLLCSKTITGSAVASPLLCWILVAMSLIGATFAGGRATILLTLLMPMVMLFFRKRFASLIVVAAAGFLLLATIGLVYQTDETLVPFMVRRSVAMIPGMETVDARVSIDSSSNWRIDLATRALTEWQSSMRTVFLGRGVYAFSAQDVIAILIDSTVGGMDAALLRGATHNAVIDHLLITGLVGIFLYHLVLFSLLYGVYQIARLRSNFDLIAALSSIVIVETIILFVAGFFGSGFFNYMTALLTSFIVVLTCREPCKNYSASVKISQDS